jgi:hypothetical protein
MRFGKFVVISVACCALSSQPVGAQVPQTPYWVFDPLEFEDTSPTDPLPLYIPTYIGSTTITSTGPTLIDSEGAQLVQVKANLLATYGSPYSGIYAGTTRSSIIRQKCQYSMDDTPPKTIKVFDSFTWSKSSQSPGYAGTSFGTFYPQSNTGFLFSESEYNPAFSAHYVSSYGQHFSSTFILEGRVSATAAAYGYGTGSINPEAEGSRGWLSQDGDHTSNGSGM